MQFFDAVLIRIKVVIDFSRLKLQEGLQTVNPMIDQVWGEPHIVTVYRKSETVYEAIGNYMCETICVNDQSEGAAIKRWREVAAGVST